jgi:hypothetical protein
MDLVDQGAQGGSNSPELGLMACSRALSRHPRSSGGKTEHRGWVAKWQRGGSSMEVVLELGEEKRRVGMGGKVAAGRKLDGGGARARRGEEESGDGCNGDRARARPFIGAGGGRRRPGKAGRWWYMATFIVVITVSEGGGNVAELRRGEERRDPVKEGARPVQFLAMAWEVGAAWHGTAARDGRWSARPAWGRRTGREGARARWAGWPAGLPRGDVPDGQWFGEREKEIEFKFQI